MDKKSKEKPELLAPAGDIDCLKAAICAGADAVYFGTDVFNARIRAKNFSLDSVETAVMLCHAHGVRVYVTLNVAVCEREMKKVLETADILYKCGVDALIVSDFGVIDMIREHNPDFELHASTQCSVHNTDGADFLYGMGCKRVVAARELDRESIKNMCANSKADIEIFVHGAHCMSFSGQCLMSFAMGGRSGNKGECAQPCRLSYRSGNKSGYFLSLKDMSLCEHVAELLTYDVKSYKIEGRMKSPEYVYSAVSVWRRLINCKRNAMKDEKSALGKIFSRQGFTDGYFISEIGSGMLGIRTESDKEKTRTVYNKIPELKKIKIDIYAKFTEGENAEITLSDGQKIITCIGDKIESAKNCPMSEDDIKKNLIKLGGTPYEADKIQIEKTGGVMIRTSTINALRRKAVRMLTGLAEDCTAKADKDYKSSDNSKSVCAAEDVISNKNVHNPWILTDKNAYMCENTVPKNFNVRYAYKDIHKFGHIRRISTAVFSDANSIPRDNPFDICFVYADRYKTDARVNGIYLPPVIFDREWQDMESKLESARKSGIEYALVSNIGQIDRVKKLGFKMIADFRFNVFNISCVDFLIKCGFENVILSPELTLAQMRDMQGAAVIVYGKFPVMTTQKCIIKDTAGCEKCRTYLIDRTNASFFAEGVYGHRNIIYNSVPVYMADKLNTVKDFSHHFIFSDETKEECEKIVRAYKNALAADGKIRRIK